MHHWIKRLGIATIIGSLALLAASFAVPMRLDPVIVVNGRIIVLNHEMSAVIKTNPGAGRFVASFALPYQLGLNTGWSFPLWPVPATLAAVVVLVPRSRRKPGHCRCGYNLTGNTSGTCPECGEPVEPA
jgi:hypothetical protein